MSEASVQNEAQGPNKRDKIVKIISSVLDKVGQDKEVSLNSILAELRDLLLVIEETRSELGSARPGDIKGKHIPGATDELDAIVTSTSEATGTIMDCCEVIQEHAMSAGGEHGDVIVAEVMKIYEACSFQDITGQRTTKVVKAFQDIESKIDKLVSVMGFKASGEQGEDDEREGDERLLNGPQLEGQGISQDDIDKLLAELDGTD